MAYIDGFAIPVPIAHKQQFIGHATNTDSMFRELGATRRQADDLRRVCAGRGA